jgi:hypothetical protein
VSGGLKDPVIKFPGRPEVVMKKMYLGLLVFGRPVPIEALCKEKVGATKELLGKVLKGQLLVLLVFPVVIIFLVPVVFGQEHSKGIPVLLLVKPGMLQ